jgi:Bifunctional DNA primase/polymerase, N-terminal/Family of unknown function (DUF5906)
MSVMKTAAITYAAMGWFIFPLYGINDDGKCACGDKNCADSGKHPMTKFAPRGCKDATRDLAKIESWFIDETLAVNIALATGEASGVTVIDVDIGPGKLGAESWADLNREEGEPSTLYCRTGSGGIHAFFQYNSALKTSANVLGKGVDCRNDGGYVVLAPSRHRSGGQYEWMDFDVKPIALPARMSRRKETRGRKKKDLFNAKYSINAIADMLKFIPSDDRDLWRSFGIILGREFKRSEEAWAVYVEWADKCGGQKGRNHDAIMRECFFEHSQQDSTHGASLSIGTLVKHAVENGWAPKTGEVPKENFVFYGPENNYIYRPTGSQWIATAVDSAVTPVNVDGKLVQASAWLRTHQLATSMTSEPRLAEDYIKGLDCLNGELVEVEGAALFNSYKRPNIEPGDASKATPFLDHVRRVFPLPGDADQFLDYMAHRVQLPHIKPRFALLISGDQGVGKDTAIEFCIPAIGPWNVANIDPQAFDSAFNEFAASTLVRINEAANLHEMSKWAFNERTKVLIAGSPDTCVVNPKYGGKYSVRMYCGVIITTNNLASGIYIPADDRRYDVIQSATKAEMNIECVEKRREYFTRLWTWFTDEDGARHVAAYLAERDITKFSPSNGQRRTSAHTVVVGGGLSSDQWLDDILDNLGYPDGVRSDWIINAALQGGNEKENEVKRKLNASIGRLGYVLFHCDASRDGRWKIGDKKCSVYVKPSVNRAEYNPLVELASNSGGGVF